VVGFAAQITKNRPTGGSAPAEVASLEAPGRALRARSACTRFTSGGHAGTGTRRPGGSQGALPAGARFRGGAWLAAEKPVQGNGAIMEPFLVAFALNPAWTMAVLIVAKRGQRRGGRRVLPDRRARLKSIGLDPAQVVVGVP